MKKWGSFGISMILPILMIPVRLISILRLAAPAEVELLAAPEKQAHKRGIQVETLVNLWLQQKLDEQKEKAAG